jgi:pimeloyl-ACP methyl ester carboxylesterase
MKAVVFVPGIMGTELFSGPENGAENIWPPTPIELKTSYRRTDKLFGDKVRPGDIIRNVLCFDVYGSLVAQFEDMGFKEKAAPGAQQRLYLFPYDWRLDLEHTADELARRLDGIDADGTQDIYIVAHSMGGLVCRLVLETGAYVKRPWFGKIRTFIAMATPHQGAPLALARVLGLDSELGISANDFRRLSNDERYPSAYQLLPAPNEAACWNRTDLALGAVDIYHEETAKRLGLNPKLLTRARFVHDSLARGSAPERVRYFYFAGTGHETVTRVNVLQTDNGTYPPGDMVVTRTEDAGDGTVPFWSALPRPVQKQVVVNEHMQVFRGLPFKQVFYRLLGSNLGPALQADLQAKRATQLSIPTPVIREGREFELLVVPAEPTGKITGTLFLHRLNEDGTSAADPEEMSTAVYEGPRLSRLRLLMPAVSVAGFYELQFKGTPADSEPLTFAVVSFPK